ncbi:hypothetical protein H6768_05845 [Candidatus Peribacteria bacterium]|nr:hypothetical protein [Candidatus Peribacteria bacterium]
MDEINYRVVRGLLSATASTQVQQVEINLDDIQTKTTESSNTHPLLRKSGE